MNTFRVTSIVDGDTFSVEPNWEFNGSRGTRVRPAGYDAPEIGGIYGAAATSWLAGLILNRHVQLGRVYEVHYERLVCEVFFNGRNLVEYYKDRFSG